MEVWEGSLKFFNRSMVWIQEGHNGGLLKVRNFLEELSVPWADRQMDSSMAGALRQVQAPDRQHGQDSEEKEMGLTGQKRGLFLDLPENWGFHSVTINPAWM